jgi:hypothetical protein
MKGNQIILMVALLLTAMRAQPARGDEANSNWKSLAAFFDPPAQYAGKLGPYRSPLLFDDGTPVRNAQTWQSRRQQIIDDWQAIIGKWPPLIERPRIEYLKTERRENFTQHKVRVQIAGEQMDDGYLLVPDGNGPFPAVFVPFYEPETSTGLGGRPGRDFALQLTRLGFVTLSIGSPGGDARRPVMGVSGLQPLHFLGYVGANCYNALASLPQVDPKRIGIVGHSYGGKWAMFASCFCDKYAAAVWSDPDLVWDEKRPNANYWEPWYLGLETNLTRRPGLITPDNPRTGAYKTLVESGHDLIELHALMAPRPLLVSGGAEDPPARWPALNHLVQVDMLLGYSQRVGLTSRPAHDPTPESNQAICTFFEHFLKEH